MEPLHSEIFALRRELFIHDRDLRTWVQPSHLIQRAGGMVSDRLCNRLGAVRVRVRKQWLRLSLMASLALLLFAGVAAFTTPMVIPTT